MSLAIEMSDDTPLGPNASDAEILDAILSGQVVDICNENEDVDLELNGDDVMFSDDDDDDIEEEEQETPIATVDVPERITGTLNKP